MIYKGQIYEKIKCPHIFNGNFEKLAKSRGYSSIQEAEIDSSKIYSLHKHNPFLIDGMNNFVDRVLFHIQNGSKIMIFGDYDVDGISAASVMLKGLSYFGVDIENLLVVIPNRVIGYSIKKEYIIEELESGGEKPDVIITVDCGIRSGTDIDYIVNNLGIEVIVTDHHSVDEEHLPTSASAVINPHMKSSNYPFEDISGSLVALKAIEALNTRIPFISGANGNPGNAIKELEEIAMLGTIADVMPIKNENKWLVKETLPRLSFSKNLGLLVFTNELRKKYKASAEDSDYNTDFIGWSVGPRINAAGRIDNPYLPLSMLLTNNVDEANTIYKSLDNTNKTRQEIVKGDYDKAKKEADTSQNGIVYINQELKDGVIGLIAGRLKEDFYLPTIVLGARNSETGVFKGSCRSIPGLNVYEALNEINNYYIQNISENDDEPLMLGFGGHPLAAGLSLKEDRIETFIELFISYCNQYVSKEMKKRDIVADGLINDFSKINVGTMDLLKKFGPYGNGNPEPLFIFQGRIKLADLIGKTKQTAKFKILDENGEEIDGIIFKYTSNEKIKEVIEKIVKNNYKGEISFLGKLTKNSYKGIQSLQVQIEDIIL